MKRLLSLLLASMLFLSLSACAQSDPTDDTTAATREPMVVLGGDMRASSKFQSLEEIAYLKFLLDKDDADALEAYISQVEEDYRPYLGRLALTDSIPDLKDFFGSFGNIEVLFPRLDSGFRLESAKRFDIELDTGLFEKVDFNYTQNDYSIYIALRNFWPKPTNRDPDAQLFIDGKAVDIYEGIEEDGRKRINIYLNAEDNPTYINIFIPKGAEDLPLEEILTFTTLNEFLDGVTPLDPMIDATAEPTTEPT